MSKTDETQPLAPSGAPASATPPGAVVPIPTDPRTKVIVRDLDTGHQIVTSVAALDYGHFELLGIAPE